MKLAEGHPYTPEELKRVQRIGLEMLIEIDRICRKCDIAYEIDGGTLLGAVRSFQYPIGCLLSMMFLIPFGSLISCRT